MSKLFNCTFLLVILLSYIGQAQAKEWEVSKGINFNIFYREEVPEYFIHSVADSAESNFREISENLGIARYQSWGIDKKSSIYIYKDEDDYVKNGNQAGWSHGAALWGTKIIKTYPADQGFFDSILPHEIGHIILHEFVGPYAELPLWFDEGIAMYQERARRMGNVKVVKEAIENGQFIPLTQLADMRLYKDSDRALIDLFYAESSSVVSFMITQLGEEHFRKLCRELKEHTKFTEALSKVYMNIKDLDDLNKKWVESVKNKI